MKTLVYFASGPIKKEYQDLDFDRIYLIDHCFVSRQTNSNIILKRGKIICIGMDCLESIAFLKKENVKIDCFVSLNEGLYEGGGTYAINSDAFLGFVMPLLKEQYIHIVNKTYYHNRNDVSMDLPYNIEEIEEKDSRYLSPFIFSKAEYHIGHAKVFKMSKLDSKKTKININPKISLNIIHDSIWNYYEELESLVIKFALTGKEDFFIRIPKVLNKKSLKLDDIINHCKQNKIQKIGFSPWGNGNYKDFIKKLKEHTSDFPKEVYLFHLNKNDYQETKTLERN